MIRFVKWLKLLKSLKCPHFLRKCCSVLRCCVSYRKRWHVLKWLHFVINVFLCEFCKNSFHHLDIHFTSFPCHHHHHHRCYSLSTVADSTDRSIVEDYQLLWGWHRHQDFLNRIMIDHERNIVFTADRGGVILSWNLEDGTPLHCFASSKARHDTLIAPKISVFLSWTNLLVEFFQLCTFTFSIGFISWGALSEKFNPFDRTSTIFQFNLSADLVSISVIHFIWISSVAVIWIFLVLFVMGYKLKYATSWKGQCAQKILGTVTWGCTTIGFIPLLRNLLRCFSCSKEDLDILWMVQECADGIHILYMILTVIPLCLYVPLAFRFSYLEGDIGQCDVYSWISWKGDQPDTKRVHSCSQRSNDLAPVEKSVKVVMVATSVFLGGSAGTSGSSENSSVSSECEWKT